MTKEIIAVTGVSGIGKSTLLYSLARLLPLTHLQASTLIQEARNASGGLLTKDQLRLNNISDNQKLLVAGFRLAAELKCGLIILDAHTVIETGDELVFVGSDVFGAIGVNKMIFLQDEPQKILERRRNDAYRNRPLPEIDRINYIQELALEQSFIICNELNISLNVYRPDQLALIADSLCGERDSN